jgi:hypothetical protein
LWHEITLSASSIGSSLSRVSSSSPSSTPTDSDTHSHVGGHVVLQTINHHSIPTSISMHNNHGTHHNMNHSTRSSGHDEEIAPPIANRPERTKSIVIFEFHYSYLILILLFFSIHVQLMKHRCHPYHIHT